MEIYYELMFLAMVKPPVFGVADMLIVAEHILRVANGLFIEIQIMSWLSEITYGFLDGDILIQVSRLMVLILSL